jgi:hypothetical protein
MVATNSAVRSRASWGGDNEEDDDALEDDGIDEGANDDDGEIDDDDVVNDDDEDGGGAYAFAELLERLDAMLERRIQFINAPFKRSRNALCRSIDNVR